MTTRIPCAVAGVVTLLLSACPAVAQVRVETRVERGRSPAPVPPRLVEIEAAIRLMEHPLTRSAEIAVAAREGRLVLSGSVPDQSARRLAEELVTPLAAGMPVVNELDVRPAPGDEAEPLPAAELATLARESLDAAVHDLVPDLQVSAVRGVVVVEGLVPDPEARFAVSHALRDLAGARAIRNMTYMLAPPVVAPPDEGTRVSVPIRIGNIFGMDLEIGSRRGMSLDLGAAGHPLGVYVDWGRSAPEREKAIAEAFIAACEQDGHVNLEAMRFRVAAGVLFFEGTFPSQAARMRAVALASRVGARGLVDATELEAREGAPAPPYFHVRDLERYLEYYLATRAGVWDVDVDEDDDELRVRGNVLTPFHEQTARQALAALGGIRNVTGDFRVVRPRAPRTAR